METPDVKPGIYMAINALLRDLMNREPDKANRLLGLSLELKRIELGIWEKIEAPQGK